MELHRYTDADIRRDIEVTALAYGDKYAHAAEQVVPAVIYGLSKTPCTVTRVQGRRFVWVTSEGRPDPHLIHIGHFTDEHGTPLRHLIDAAAQPGER